MSMTTKTPDEKIANARSWLSLKSIFYGARIISTPMVKGGTPMGTMATDGRRIYWDEGFVERTSTQHIIGVLVHEMLHGMMLHSFRFDQVCAHYMAKYNLMEHQVHFIANVAMDFAINPIVLGDGFKLPGEPVGLQSPPGKTGYMFDKQFEGMGFEEILRKLMEDQKTREKLSNAADQGVILVGQVVPAKGTPEEQQEEMQRIQAEVRQAAISAKATSRNAGDVPGWLEQLIADWDEAQIDWKTKLHRIADRIIGYRDQSTWKKPNRRYLQQQGLYLPSKNRIGVGRIAAGIDVSGSVSDAEAKAALTECAAIVNDHHPQEFILIQYDTEIKGDPQIFEEGEEFPTEVTRRGYGGTRFEPQFNWIEKHQRHPDMMICLTDGYASFPKDPPPYPVIWVITNESITPPWGDVVRLKVED